MTGSVPEEPAWSALLKRHSDLLDKVEPLGEAQHSGNGLSYTQWEAWLALYHDKRLFIAVAGEGAERGPNYAPTDTSRAAQANHLAGLKKAGRYPGHIFISPADLAKHILSTGILELLVEAYGEELARARDVAEGFIREMAKRVAGDRRETGTVRLEEAVAAFRSALEEYTRARVPLYWATVESNLGEALQILGERESGTTRLEEAVAVHHAALEEQTRARVPLQCAMTQYNLGHALWGLGQRESGTALLKEAVAAYREALKERPPENAPPHWDTMQSNLEHVLKLLAERMSDGNGPAR